LSKTAPALQHIAAEVSVNNIPAQGTHSQADAASTDGGPAWGHLSKAWESIRDDGKKLLPMDFSSPPATRTLSLGNRGDVII
jgi:hypothetical protein